ncbi:MAG: HD-GYP domain-containing protein [Desulfobaccales bacterium]
MQAIIQVIEATIGARDPYTVEHQQRATDIAMAIAEAMGLSPASLGMLQVAGRLHDLGKIAVPIEILSKSGKLTDLEFAIIKTHPQVGYNILKPLNFPMEITQTIIQHHERMDGSGYPQGLGGQEIMLEARILAVADVLEAMCCHRPYRPALGIEKAMEEITKNRGILYDPAVVDTCLRLYQESPVILRGEASYVARKPLEPADALPERVTHNISPALQEKLIRRPWQHLFPDLQSLPASDRLLAPGFGTEADAWAAGFASPKGGWPTPEPPALAPAGSHSLAGVGEDLIRQLLGERDSEPSRPKFEKSVSGQFFQLLTALGDRVITESRRQETILSGLEVEATELEGVMAEIEQCFASPATGSPETRGSSPAHDRGPLEFPLAASMAPQRQKTQKLQEVKSMVQDFFSKNPDLAEDQDKVQMVLFSLKNYVSINPDFGGLSFRDKLEEAGQMARSFLNQSAKAQ